MLGIQHAAPELFLGSRVMTMGRDARVGGLGWALGQAPASRHSSWRPEPLVAMASPPAAPSWQGPRGRDYLASIKNTLRVLTKSGHAVVIDRC